MQSAKDPSPPQGKKERARRTTIILNEDERTYIDQLIQSGKEAGLKQLISKMLAVYRSMMIYDWKYPGEYYAGISRIAFINTEFINTLLQDIPEDHHYAVGKKAGEAAKISMEATLNLNTANKGEWSEVFKRLCIQGLGDFYQRDKYIIIKAPYINNLEVQRGYLESLLGISLETRTFNAPYVYEIVTKQ
ncbi:MAG: hypothetical protein JSV51_00340 [Candidatus Bathyarchaeota archaeon]|nr:MAG: hypothetical protein JSV51_00340 [Candidatus Bathyarchaeota archaeon]